MMETHNKPDSPLESERKHRREVRRQIAQPVILTTLALVLLGGLLLTLTLMGTISGQQLGTVAAILLTGCILLPMVVLILVLDAVMLGLVFGVGKLYDVIRTPLLAVHRLTDRIMSLTGATAERISQPVIMARGKAARWRHMAGQALGLPDMSERNR